MSAQGMSADNARLPRRTIAAVTIGNAIDVYDITVFALFAKQIAAALFSTKDPYIGLLGALFIFAVGYVARPIGGFVLGLYADKIGRKSVLIFGLLVSGIAVVAMAALPTYAQAGTLAMALAVAIRIIQGFALGAEVGTAQAYLLEASAPAHRGLSVAWQGASQGIAGAVAAAIALVLALKLSPAFFDANGWRVAFLIGGLAVPYGLYLRAALPETLNLPEARPAAPPEKSSGLTLLSAAGYIILIGAIVLGTRAIASAIAGYMTTYAEVTLGMKNTVSIAANLASSIGAAVGILIGGLASDRFGRRPVMIWPNLVFLLAIYPVYLWIVDTKSAEALWIGSTILTILTAIPGGAFFAAFTESLPKHIRSTSYSTVYSITTAIFAGTTPGAVAALIHNTGNPLAIALYLLAATAISQFAMMAIRESAPVKRGGS